MPLCGRHLHLRRALQRGTAAGGHRYLAVVLRTETERRLPRGRPDTGNALHGPRNVRIRPVLHHTFRVRRRHVVVPQPGVPALGSAFVAAGSEDALRIERTLQGCDQLRVAIA
jgi:hypothetical protein